VVVRLSTFLLSGCSSCSRASIVAVALWMGLLGLAVPAVAETFDTLARRLISGGSSPDAKTKEALIRKIKVEVLARDPDVFSEQNVLLGQFSSTGAPDVAISISFPPYRASLVLLSQVRERYVPRKPLVGLGFVESMEAVKLFPGKLQQLLLHLRGGGAGWRHWGQDLYRWDGERLRLIWAWTSRDVFKGWPPGRDGEVPGRQIQGTTFFRELNGDGTYEIVTTDTYEEGDAGADWQTLKRVTSRKQTETIHRWDNAFFYFVARYAEIIPLSISVSCRAGIPGRDQVETLSRGTRVGVLEIPGGPQSDESTSRIIAGRELFCQIPTSALKQFE
jgi:hypothetical protein